jgi:pilus assembly protein CpaC
MKHSTPRGSISGINAWFLGLSAALIFGVVPAASNAADAALNDARLTVHAGQSEILDFTKPIKRIAISNPEIADATVISPVQILVDGKTSGVTTLIVWSESGPYRKYRLSVCDDAGLRQIMLHVRFLEVNKSALREFGSDLLVKSMKIGSDRVDAGTYGGNVNAPSDPLALSNTVDFFFSIPNRNISAIFKALQDNNMLSVLAAPNLSAVSGTEANFLAGGEFPIPIVSGTMGTQTLTIQFKEYGVKLKFLPTVLDTAVVRIKVMAEVSHLDFENGIVLSGFRIPSLVTRKAETTVELEEGKVLIVGGLLSNESSEVISKIPVLGSIPILGKLFSSQRYQNKESELLVTLSPEIIQAVSKEDVPELQLRGAHENKK